MKRTTFWRNVWNVTTNCRTPSVSHVHTPSVVLALRPSVTRQSQVATSNVPSVISPSGYRHTAVALSRTTRSWCRYRGYGARSLLPGRMLGDWMNSTQSLRRTTLRLAASNFAYMYTVDAKMFILNTTFWRLLKTINMISSFKLCSIVLTVLVAYYSVYFYQFFGPILRSFRSMHSKFDFGVFHFIMLISL